MRKLVVEGIHVYEIDDECVKKKEEEGSKKEDLK